MKAYYLRLTQDDFVVDNNVWTSEIVDLYDNDSYKNFSTTKSSYGLNTLGTGVWTGLSSLSGTIEGDRFIDNTGPINIINFETSTTGLPGTGPYDIEVDIYTIDSPDAEFPDEWSVRQRAKSSQILFLSKAYRYSKFVVNFISDMDMSGVDFEILVRIEIGPPTMAPRYGSTTSLQNVFPEWMEIREAEYEPATPQHATPLSLGGKFLNALAGEWLDDIRHSMTYLNFQRYVSTADTNQYAWIYYATPAPRIIYSITGDAVELARTNNLVEFYALLEDETGFYWDEFNTTVYTNKVYDEFEINGETYSLTPQQVWNWFDDMGYALDLPRLYLEDNDTYKKRILDVYRNKPGSSLESMKKALRRELNLWYSEGATPSSDYLGATPEILEMSDIEVHEDYTAPDGLPTLKFKALVDELAKKYPIAWGFFRWDNTIWDATGLNNDGLSLLPNVFDAIPVDEEFIQPGVGDLDDLYVYEPQEYTGPENFNIDALIKGRSRNVVEEYPRVDMDIEVYGSINKRIYTNPETTVWLTVAVQAPSMDASPALETYYHSFQLSATSDISGSNPTNTPASYGSYEWAGEDGYSALGLTWLDSLGFEYSGDAATPWQIDLTEATFIRLYPGKRSGTSLVNVPSSDTFLAWFSHNSTTTLDFNDGFIAVSDFVSATPSFPHVVMSSKQSSWAYGNWESLKRFYSVSVNGAQPGMTQRNTTVSLPEIEWDSDSSDTQHLFLPGTTGRASTPDVASLDITGDIDLRIKVALDDWSSSSTQALIQKDNTTTQVSYGLGIDAGGYPYISWSPTGAVGGMLVRTATTPVPVTDGSAVWIRAVLDVNNLSFGHTVAFYTSTESTNDHSVVSWSLLGSAIVTSGTTSIFSSSSILEIGIQNNLSSPAKGRVYAAAVLSGIGGTVVANPNFTNTSQFTHHGSSGTDGTGKTWTISTSATIEDIRKVYNVKLLTQNGVGSYGGKTTDENLEPSFLSSSDIYVDDLNNWIDGVKQFASTTDSVEFSAENLTNVNRWTLFETRINNILDGAVDENGPWRNGRPPLPGNSNYRLDQIQPTWDDIGMTESPDFEITWIGVEADSPKVTAWMDDNTADNEIEDYLVSTPRTVNVRMKPGVNKPWNPSLHSGYFYTNNEEYYLYTDPKTEHATVQNYLLESVARQGAPMIVKSDAATPRDLRQVAFFNPDATPGLTLVNRETVAGTNTVHLYAAYNDLHSATVRDLDMGVILGATPYRDTNIIDVDSITTRGREYELEYKLNHSFYVDNEHVEDGEQHAKVVFSNVEDGHDIWYEKERYNVATPIDLPLNPFYTTQDEGFIFLSHTEYPLFSVESRISPSYLIADGEDYLLLTVKSLDTYGNPKPRQTFGLVTTWGLLDSDSITTDDDGFAVAILTAADTTSEFVGIIQVIGDTVVTDIEFDIYPMATPAHRLTALPSVERIPADNRSQLYVHGQVEDSDYSPVSRAIVAWSKGRTLYDTFQGLQPVYNPTYGATPGQELLYGYVVADDEGRYQIGPFVAATPFDTGYWFVAMESMAASPWSATPHPNYEAVGDVVAWYEYPDDLYGVDDYTGMPIRPDQYATPVDHWPTYTTSGNAFPVNYDEATPTSHATPVELTWIPPRWYAINKYTQYQLGLLGDGFYEVSFDSTATHPDYRDE